MFSQASNLLWKHDLFLSEQEPVNCGANVVIIDTCCQEVPGGKARSQYFSPPMA